VSRLSLIIGTVVCALALPFTAAPAGAVGHPSAAVAVRLASATTSSYPPPKDVTVAYDNQWTFISKPLRMCMLIDVSGKLKAHHRQAYSDSSPWYDWTKLRMRRPKMTMITGKRAGPRGGCDYTHPVKLEKATMVQQWYDTDCSLSATVTAGAPWSIAVTPTYYCKRHRVANRTTTYGHGHSFQQSNSGYPVSFPGDTLARNDNPLVVGGNVTVTGYRKIHHKQVSDTFHNGRAQAFMDDCPHRCLSS
jgi:hypothetical protein